MPVTSSTTDNDIALLVRRGHPEAIETLVHRHSTKLYRYLCRLLGDRSRAEDLLQETWLKVVERIDRYDPRLSFQAWLFAVARNCAIDFMRRQSREPLRVEILEDEDHSAAGALEHIADSSPSFLDQMADEQFQERVARLFHGLPPLYREALTLRFHEDLPFQEIAAILHLPASTIKTRVRRGLEVLRQRLQAEEV